MPSRNHHKASVVAVALAICLSVAGCGAGGRTSGSASGAGAGGITSPVAEQPAADPETAYEWDSDEAPNYHKRAGGAVVERELGAGEVAYGDLDQLGRATGTWAKVTPAMMRDGLARDRKDMSDLSPSGWGHNAEVDIPLPDGGTYHGYLWNRSHLLAKSLGGEERIENLVTGTRMQNVGANDGNGGIAHCETIARDWLGHCDSDGWLYYAAVPVYQGDELVPRTVVVDMLSSDGSVNERTITYNAALGYEIDYATGKWTRTEESADAAADETAAQEESERTVVISSSGKAYHSDASCRGLEKANKSKLREVTVAEAEEMGRKPCEICGG